MNNFVNILRLTLKNNIFIKKVYINYMPIAVKCNLLLYADDSCLFLQSNNVNDIDKQLDKDFASM